MFSNTSSTDGVDADRYRYLLHWIYFNLMPFSLSQIPGNPGRLNEAREISGAADSDANPKILLSLHYAPLCSSPSLLHSAQCIPTLLPPPALTGTRGFSEAACGDCLAACNVMSLFIITVKHTVTLEHEYLWDSRLIGLGPKVNLQDHIKNMFEHPCLNLGFHDSHFS